MALAVTIISRNLNGQFREVTFDYTFDSTYPAGGESLTAAQLGLAQIESITPMEMPDGYVASYDRANAKLMLFYGDNNNAADGPLIENATVDMSATNGRAIARGF